jgi:hypothetical protein
MADTTKLLNYIKRNCKIQIPKGRLSDVSKALISKIVNQMELGVNSWKLNHTYREHILKINEFPTGPDYDYVIDEVKAELASKNKIGKRYEFHIGSRKFTIYAIYPYTSRIQPKVVYEMFDAAVRKMYIWLFIANHFSSSECSPQITIYWYLTDKKKELPREPVPIDRQHVNTAFTFACPTSANVIYIYRREEWFKVLIHESFHSFGLDFSNMDETLTRKEMFSIFPIQCDLRFAETYAECWAEILNVLFICVNQYSCNEKMIDISKLSRQIERKMQNEVLFSIFQMCKVLKHYNLHYLDLYTGYGKKYAEKSHVFSYFILKCILLFNFNEFIEWCVIQNSGSFDFTKSQMNILSLVQMIKKKHTDAEFVTIVAEMEAWFSSTKQKGWMMDTMRMSISE